MCNLCDEYVVRKYNGKPLSTKYLKVLFGTKSLLIPCGFADDQLQEIASVFTCVLKEPKWKTFSLFSVCFSTNTFYASN
jgi:hypothetical protein